MRRLPPPLALPSRKKEKKKIDEHSLRVHQYAVGVPKRAYILAVLSASDRVLQMRSWPACSRSSRCLRLRCSTRSHAILRTHLDTRCVLVPVHGHARVCIQRFRQFDCSAVLSLTVSHSSGVAPAAEPIADRRSSHRFQRTFVVADAAYLPERWLVSARQDNRWRCLLLRAIRD